ncbi:Phosphate transporter [Sesamum angolense]|uniref:Phosphate transporter n=1 Tax=Sesamum angolense TaxID=2727404 RepID=A0AAE2C628_9LAMI|nr:Phosphate transporter [Sesamum angolense]
MERGVCRLQATQEGPQENPSPQQPQHEQRATEEFFSQHIFAIFEKIHFLQHKQRDNRVIRVHRKLAVSASKGDLYETELLEQFSDTDAAIEFFTRLDFQLNKVNQFFRMKEKEFLERGNSLKNQMEILMELKTAVKQKQAKGPSSQEEDSISGTILCDEESIKESADEEQELENSTDNLENHEVEFSDSLGSDEPGKSITMKKEEGKLRSLSGRVINFQGKSLRIHIPLTNPTRTFSAISYLLWDDLVNQSSKKCGTEGSKLHVSKKKLLHAEKMIRGAFVELYKGLGYLKTYRNLNMLAFVKILKKFDKVTNKQVLPIYLKVVESSYFNSSDKALKLADEVEELFVKHFGGDDRRKAMKYLKPTQRKESHCVTFSIGLLTGCFLALLVGYVIMAHITGMYGPRSDAMYMETVYPVLSMFSLLFLHFFLYGCNIVMWRKTRINYSFIFELASTKELKHSDVFLICTTSMAAVIGILFVHLSLVAKGYSYAHVQAIPGLLFLGFILVLVCPFNIIYKSSRYCFLSVIRNIILSPLYKVVMLDFFMADQLCSQVPMLRDLEYMACYYITGSYKTQDYQYCMRTTYYRDLAYAVSFLPYYWRAMQCARRWFDEGQKPPSKPWKIRVCNAGSRRQSGVREGKEHRMALSTRSRVKWCNSVPTLLGLCKGLGAELKKAYYLMQGLNLLLRLAWLQTVFHYNFEKVDYRVTMLFLAALEVVRRGQWNFYRLENEHLNNAGKYRAVKTVPLPFMKWMMRD